uniref:Uncharacterized protein n=1 Tax=Helicotheca tamesis TaxID=374047 RepID=A0A7S2DWT7_9STRA|mmetsp:Transcript_10516/g.14749  ORF Transcript_10516/g.14749 Transcript_10516/m.14749 type:complete len:182 (+) Transcript_10516:89-634(+)
MNPMEPEKNGPFYKRSLQVESSFRMSLTRSSISFNTECEIVGLRPPVLEENFNLASKDAFKHTSSSRRGSSCSTASSLTCDGVNNSWEGTQAVHSPVSTEMKNAVKDIVSKDCCWTAVQQKIKTARLVTSLGVPEVLGEYIQTHAEELQRREEEERTQQQMESQTSRTRNMKKRLSVVMRL